jgi:hypothetical protein
MTIRFAMLALACLLSGCAGNPVAMETDARSNYEKSAANYQICLAATHQSVSACEAQRRTMDADERAFKNLSADASTK